MTVIATFNQANTSVIEAISDHVFDTPAYLSADNWELNIESGDAWIFTDTRNFALRNGETVSLTPEDGEIKIKGLFVRSTVTFTAYRMA